jgi:hypothetical protein
MGAGFFTDIGAANPWRRSIRVRIGTGNQSRRSFELDSDGGPAAESALRELREYSRDLATLRITKSPRSAKYVCLALRSVANWPQLGPEFFARLAQALTQLRAVLQIVVEECDHSSIRSCGCSPNSSFTSSIREYFVQKEKRSPLP